MGSEWGLVDRAKREQFDLGKGPWSALDELSDLIVPRALHIMLDYGWDPAYATRVALRIAKFMEGRGPVELVNDADNSWDDCFDWPEVGSRYDERGKDDA